MSSRRKTIEALNRTEKRLYQQTATLNAHKNYWINWFKKNQTLIIALTIPLVAVVLRVSASKKRLQSIKRVIRLITLTALASARKKIIHSAIDKL